MTASMTDLLILNSDSNAKPIPSLVAPRQKNRKWRFQALFVNKICVSSLWPKVFVVMP